MGETIRRQVLPNGLILLTEEMTEFRSVCLGIWMRKGSRHELPAENGITHFIEHLVFKGTETRSAREIAKILDQFGGANDASTGKEQTNFFAKVLDQHLDDAVELLGDIVLRPAFDPEEIEREREVIFEEIRMVEDSPEELLYDLFTEAIWGDHPLGRPIQGTEGSVGAMDRDGILDYFRRSYTSGNLIVSAAGNLSHDHLAEVLGRVFDGLPAGNGAGFGAPPDTRSKVLLREKKELEQLHLCLGVPAFQLDDPRRYVGALLNTILGGNMSSRLFQAVREERGLVYTVYSSLQCYADAGYLMVYLATAPDKVPETMDLVIAELTRMRQEPVGATELAEAKAHVKGSMMLALESSSNRMSNLARQEIYFGRQSSLDEVLEEIERVSREDVLSLATDLFAGAGTSVAAVGRVEDAALTTTPPVL